MFKIIILIQFLLDLKFCNLKKSFIFLVIFLTNTWEMCHFRYRCVCMCVRISNIRAIVWYNGRHPWSFCFFLSNLRPTKTRFVLRERAFVSARVKKTREGGGEQEKERTKGCITGIEIGAKSRGFLGKSSTISGFHRLLDGRECRRLNNSWAFVARWIPTKYLVKHNTEYL